MSLSRFLESATVPRDADHASGSLEEADALLRSAPGLSTTSIHAAAVLGDDATVRQLVQEDPALANARGGAYRWDPLTYLCFSRYLRLDPSRAAGFLHAARALLDAGADPHSGWFSEEPQGPPMWESLLYGAAAIAGDPDLTRLLLEHGADPNDDETPYHTPESYDNRALQVLVLSGRLTPDSMATMLLRKIDWHDGAGIEWLLAHGADPNRMTRWGRTALQHAVLRDNDTTTIGFLLAAGANPDIASSQVPCSSVALAAHRGRADLLTRFARHGSAVALTGLDALLAACALNDSVAIQALLSRTPGLRPELVARGGQVLAEFAGVGNVDGVQRLLELGISADARWTQGDGYWDVAPGSTALHVAARRGRHATVRLLLEQGTSVHAVDGAGRTPLMLAVRACVDAYGSDRRSSESVALLLAAGASPSDIRLPSGYDEVDQLLRNRSPR